MRGLLKANRGNLIPYSPHLYLLILQLFPHPFFSFTKIQNLQTINYKPPPLIPTSLIYTTEDGKETFEVNLKEETVWLNLNQISKLFERDKSVISRHIRNIFETEELSGRSVVANFATTATDGKVYKVDFYNLDLIISVGYRVNSKRGTQFRIWATNVLKNHLIQGYTINQKRLQESQAKIKELQKTSRMIERLLLQKNLESICFAFPMVFK